MAFLLSPLCREWDQSWGYCVTVKAAEDLWTSWDGEVCGGWNCSLCASCRRLWCLRWSCEPALGVSYLSTNLWIFFFFLQFSLITEPGLSYTLALLPWHVFVQIPYKKKIELSVKFLPASVLPVIMSEYYFNSLVQGELASARWSEHRGRPSVRLEQALELDWRLDVLSVFWLELNWLLVK